MKNKTEKNQKMISVLETLSGNVDTFSVRNLIDLSAISNNIASSKVELFKLNLSAPKLLAMLLKRDLIFSKASILFKFTSSKQFKMSWVIDMISFEKVTIEKKQDQIESEF